MGWFGRWHNRKAASRRLAQVRRVHEWRPPERIPDHDTVHPGQGHRDPAAHGGAWHRPGNPFWSPLLGDWIDERTQELPVIDRPLLTLAGWWRANGGRW